MLHFLKENNDFDSTTKNVFYDHVKLKECFNEPSSVLTGYLGSVVYQIKHVDFAVSLIEAGVPFNILNLVDFSEQTLLNDEKLDNWDLPNWLKQEFD